MECQLKLGDDVFGFIFEFIFRLSAKLFGKASDCSYDCEGGQFGFFEFGYSVILVTCIISCIYISVKFFYKRYVKK
ncbi:Uncharacterised protein [BD1-7 clade bacterium]|uniref:Uncharacterized protein n=1 Tax=BD1-7 clade bacterium TaxID=2029982 RepID=A0A5S9NQL6_9GAMM|nr:Uncharacterised protein [BD1-7 clade bacterium]